MNIENLKKLLRFTLSFTQQLSESLKDGLQWKDVLSFLDEAMQVPGLVRSWEDVKSELLNLDLAERDALNRWIKETYDIPDDKLEAVTESALMAAISLVSLYSEFKAIR